MGTGVKAGDCVKMNLPETVLLIDSWKDQESLDRHHASAMMSELAKLREKYDLHMTVERYVSDTEDQRVMKGIIATLLIVLLIMAVSFGACGKSETPKNESKIEKTEEQIQTEGSETCSAMEM